MRVLHIGKYFPPYKGGMETYLRDLMVSQKKSGISSRALVHQSSISYRSHSDTYEADGQALPVYRVAVWLRLMFTPISPSFPWALNRLIKHDRPELLHLHMPNVSAFWALLLPAARRIPWVIHWHSDVVASQHSSALRLFYSLYRPFERALLNKSKAVIVTSPPYLESSVPLQDYQHKSRVVPLGINDTAYLRGAAGNARQSTENQTLRVLATGRLTYYKGFEYLIRAAATIEQVEVHFVGSGDLFDQLKTLSRQLSMDERVTFHGQLPAADLVHQYHLCDCLCLPSIERTEAFGMVLLEAMCCGKATVISDVKGSGMGWVVEDEVTGLKVQPEDSIELANALRQLQINRDKITALGANGREKFYRLFHIDQSAAEIANVYDDILTTAGKPEAAGSI